MSVSLAWTFTQSQMLDFANTVAFTRTYICRNVLQVGKGLRQMIYSLVISLPGTLNIMALLMLCILVYAITGMFLFSNVKLNGTLTASFNFRTFKNSALLLLSLSTAAGWNDVLQALLISAPLYAALYSLQTDDQTD